MIAALIVFAGLKIAKRKTKAFPYGLYKVENFISFFVAFAIFYAGYAIVMEVIKGDTDDIHNIFATAISVIFVIVISYLFSRYEGKVGKDINSPSLIAEAQHIYIDMFANTVVLIALFSNYSHFNYDKIAAFIIAAFIIWSGGKMLLDCIRVLLDASLDYKTLRYTEKLISDEPQVVEIQNLIGRNSGRYKFIETNLVIKTRTLDKAHIIVSQIEKRIKEKIKNVDKVLIHYEPAEKEYRTYAIPLEDIKQDQYLSSQFGDAPYFALITVERKNNIVINQKYFFNSYRKIKRCKGILLANSLNRHSIDVLVVKKGFAGKGPSYALSNANVKIVKTEEETVKKALKKLDIHFNKY